MRVILFVVIDLLTADYIIQNFLNSSKSISVKESTKATLLYLSNLLLEYRKTHEWWDDKGGWIRPKDLLTALVESGSIPYNTQFFRLLDRLCEAQLIEKKEESTKNRERGKPPTYYRATIAYPEYLFYDRKGLIKEIEIIGVELQGAKAHINEILKHFVNAGVFKSIEEGYEMTDPRGVQTTLKGLVIPPDDNRDES